MFSRSPAKATTKESLEIDGMVVTLIRSARRRTLTLEVDHSGIRARAPRNMALQDIEGFIRLKKNWLSKHYQNAPSPVAKLSLKNRSSLPLNGQMLTLKIENRRGSVSIDSDLDEPIINVPILLTRLPEYESVRRKLITWYKKLSLHQMNELVSECLELMEGDNQGGAPNPSVRVREYKRRWGSCDHNGNLAFNWRLIMAPKEVQRYVVVHELAHRQEFNHSKRFWQIVSLYDPNWKHHQQWLHKHGFTLYRL